MLEISLAYKDWLFYWSTKSKNEKNVEKTQKNCKISIARGVFGTAKKVKFTYQQQVHL